MVFRVHEAQEPAIPGLVQVVSPRVTVNDLPDDALREIMKAVHLHHFPHCRLYSGSFVDSPVPLTHVCRRWRQTATSIRALWSCIHITPKQPVGYHNMLEFYLARSGNAPLTILFVCHTNAFRENPEWDIGWEDFQESKWPGFKLCWSQLVLQQNRWRHCAIFSLFAEGTVYFLKSLDGAFFPQLEYLGITSYSEIDDATAPDCTLAFSAPALKHFRTDVLPVLQSGPDVFRGVTELKLNKIEMDGRHFLQILSTMFSTLTSLALSEVQFSSTRLLAPAPVTLPRLQYLALCLVLEFHPILPFVSETRNIASLLCQGSPNLTTLHISGDKDFLIHIVANTTTFSTVQRLEYATARLERHICTFLSRFPSLRELDLLQPTNMPSLLNEISNFERTESLWPNLHSMAIQGYVEESVLLRFVQNRARTGHPVRKLFLSKGTLAKLHNPAFEAMEKLHVDVSGAYPGQRRDPGSGELTIPAWDTEKDRPAFIPWNGTYAWNFYDQF